MAGRSRVRGLGRVCSWVIDPTRRWFARCDRCGHRWLLADYYEVYGNIDADHIADCTCCQKKGRTPDALIWWWECTHCLLKTISRVAESSDDCPLSGG
jgi:hypothetical protein